jgi:valyl-tRNA synthetase
MDDVPFKEIYIHGLVRDSHGKKMSKSKGNVLDPIDVIDGIELEALVTKRGQNLMQPEMAPKIEKQTRKDFPNGISAFGTDALRFTFASLASTGRDINFDLKRVEGYRNFCNKLWNAARYVLMNAEGFDNGLNANDEIELSVSDKWIISRLQQVEAEVERHFNQYRFDLAANLLYEFTWSEYCGWYLELSKPVLNNDNASDAQKRGTRRTLVRVMETLLRLLHPMVPFITEEIWQTVAPLAAKEGDTIMNQPFPQSDESKIDQDSLEQLAWIQDFILGIRRIRAEMDIAPGKPLPVLLSDGDSSDVNKIKEHALLIKSLARLESITWLEGEAPEAAIALVGKLKLLIPLAGLIDKDAELTRLNREIEKLDKEMGRLAGKLNNKNFVDRAPEAVVAKEKEKLGVAQESLQQLKAQAEKIKTM